MDIIKKMEMRSKINQNPITDGRYTATMKEALKHSNKRRLSNSKIFNYRWKWYNFITCNEAQVFT